MCLKFITQFKSEIVVDKVGLVCRTVAQLVVILAQQVDCMVLRKRVAHSHLECDIRTADIADALAKPDIAKRCKLFVV